MTAEASTSPGDMEDIYDKMFANRYTESDTDFQNEISKPLSSPPCVPNWYTKRRNDWGRRNDGRGRGGGYHQSRGNWGHQRDYHGDRHDRHDRRDHYGDRRGHYGGGGGGRGHYGDRSGRGGYHGDRDRHRDYNRDQGNRYGNRPYN